MDMGSINHDTLQRHHLEPNCTQRSSMGSSKSREWSICGGSRLERFYSICIHTYIIYIYIYIYISSNGTQLGIYRRATAAPMMTAAVQRTIWAFACRISMNIYIYCTVTKVNIRSNDGTFTWQRHHTNKSLYSSIIKVSLIFHQIGSGN